MLYEQKTCWHNSFVINEEKDGANLETTKYTIACCCSNKANIKKSTEGPPALSRFNCEILPSSLAQKMYLIYKRRHRRRFKKMIGYQKSIPPHFPHIHYPFQAFSKLCGPTAGQCNMLRTNTKQKALSGV